MQAERATEGCGFTGEECASRRKEWPVLSADSSGIGVGRRELGDLLGELLGAVAVPDHPQRIKGKWEMNGNVWEWKPLFLKLTL